MREWQSQSHVKWYCRYHIVFVPKYRKKAIFGTLRRGIGKILRELCKQQKVELVEGHAMGDHVHLCFEHSAKVQRGEHGGSAEREIGNPNSPAIHGKATEFHGLPLLGSGLLCKYGRTG